MGSRGAAVQAAIDGGIALPRIGDGNWYASNHRPGGAVEMEGNRAAIAQTGHSGLKEGHAGEIDVVVFGPGAVGDVIHITAAFVRRLGYHRIRAVVGGGRRPIDPRK